MHFQEEIIQPARMAQNKFNPYRLSGDAPNPFDHVLEILGVGDIRMAIRADGVLSLGYAAGFGDDVGDFLTGQNAALAGFRALRQFDLKHLDGLMSSNFPKLLIAQLATRIANTVFGGANLEGEVAVALKMEG